MFAETGCRGAIVEAFNTGSVCFQKVYGFHGESYASYEAWPY